MPKKSTISRMLHFLSSTTFEIQQFKTKCHDQWQSHWVEQPSEPLYSIWGHWHMPTVWLLSSRVSFYNWLTHFDESCRKDRNSWHNTPRRCSSVQASDTSTNVSVQPYSKRSINNPQTMRTRATSSLQQLRSNLSYSPHRIGTEGTEEGQLCDENIEI